MFEVAADVLAWRREGGGERVLVLLNLADEARECDLRRSAATAGDVIVATSGRSGTVSLDRLRLEPLEGLALRL